jgi:general secretion pathway protein A
MHNSFYGLTEEPFGLAPDPRFFFETEYHKEIIDSLIYAIGEREGLILITGEGGLGKTALIQKLVQTLSPQVTAIPVFQPPATFEDLLGAILRQLNLPWQEKNKGGMLSEFDEYLHQKSSQNETLAIIVDEAQKLSPEVLEDLRLMCNPDPRKPRLLKEVFFGEPQIEEKLNSPELRQLTQRITTCRRLRPLTEQESWDYLVHRINIVGKNGSDIFTPEAISLICRKAKGIPRYLNTICYTALSAGYALDQKIIDPPLVHKILPIFGGQQSSRWLLPKGPLALSLDRLGKSPLLTKISFLLLAYSLLAWIIFFLLTIQ